MRTCLVVLACLVLTSPLSHASAPSERFVDQEAAATLDRLDAGELPEGTHIVFARVTRRSHGDDLVPRARLRLVRAEARGDRIHFKPTRHKVDYVGWLPAGPGVWRLPVTWVGEG
ncbi:MAG: hypothetical protein GY898_09010 [Proteobacteria bacterium]|nr:hypothetical protein [Pseudomonadota bacterium]